MGNDDTVASRMTRDPMTLSPDDNLREAVQLELKMRIRHFPVVENGKLVGIVTDRDIKRILPSPLTRAASDDYEAILDGTDIRKVMTRDPASVGPNTKLADALTLMVEKKIGGLPVVEGGKLVGILTQTDALKLCLELLKK